MGGVDLSEDGTLIAEYELSADEFQRLTSRVGSMLRGEHKTPHHGFKFLFWVAIGFVFFACLKLLNWSRPTLPGFGFGMLTGIALAGTALMWIAVWQRIQGRKIYARLVGPQPVRVKLHESGISWSNSVSQHFYKFEAVDDVSSFDGGLLFRSRSGAIHIPGKFIHQTVEGRPLMEILRARLPGMDWRKVPVS